MRRIPGFKAYGQRAHAGARQGCCGTTIGGSATDRGDLLLFLVDQLIKQQQQLDVVKFIFFE